MADSASRGRVAIVVGGGPAPGINGVISSVTIEAINQGLEVFGIRDGFKHLTTGDLAQFTKLTLPDAEAMTLSGQSPNPSSPARKLTIPDVAPHYQRGGSILGTSRTNPAKKDEDMRNVLASFEKLGVKYLVTIGGDDTAFSGSQVYKRAGGAIKVAHVPKTIDNDLPLPPGVPTFGFETARHIGVGLARNLHEDAKTTTRWYIIVSMGRAAGHLALGIGKASAATVTIISEEFRGRQVGMDEICDIIIGSIVKRRALGKGYGLAILAEGLIEAIGETNLVADLGRRRLLKDGLREAGGDVVVSRRWADVNVFEVDLDPAELQALRVRDQADGTVRLDAAAVIKHLGSNELRLYGTLERDPHGHLRLGEIEFGRMIRDRVTERLAALGLKFTMIDKELGYELRCADPIPFDAEYTRNLGYGAVKFLLSPEADRYGAIISFVEGKLHPLPFEEMINPATQRMRPRLVDTNSETFECARRYMIRLEKGDFDEPDRLAKLAAVVGLTPDQFRDRFAYLIK
jgi:6-phosphofructokinase